MQDLFYTLDDHLKEAGATVPFVGHLDEKHFSVGEHELELPDGLDYDLMLTNAGEGILVTGILRTHAQAACDRCLGPAELDLSCEVDEYFLFHEPEARDGEDDDFDYELISPDKTLDIAHALSSALVMEVPFVILCDEDCKGLCPVCGANLNEEDCGHARQLQEEREREREANNPFAKLKELKLDE